MTDGLFYVPLGGAGEIGMNVYLYGYGPEDDPTWIMVDCGIGFGNGTVPGVDVVLPDIGWIARRRHRLAGIVLTHAHEDHLGAVHYLWRRLRCPVWASPFAATMLRGKLAEAQLLDEVPLNEVPLSGAFRVGPFDLRYVSMTHSIPEPNALAIATPLGTVVHSGDFKFDPAPVIGTTADEAALSALGDAGVLALVCDSTNVFTQGDGESESALKADFVRLIKAARGQVAVTCFATNVARLETILAAARAARRDVCLVGRSLHRIVDAARRHGMLQDAPQFIDEAEAGYIPEDRILYICTGCQGEPRAALSRIAGGAHRNVRFGRGDTVIFSSRIIPGNELSVEKVHNELVRQGVKVITWADAHVHVSGHPARGELRRLYRLLRPGFVVPMHGESRHLREQAALAEESGIEEGFVVENGNMARLAPDGPFIVEEVPVGRHGLDGLRLVPIEGEIVKERTRALWNGSVVATVVVDGKGKLVARPRVSAHGLLEPGEGDLLVEAAAAAAGAVNEVPRQCVHNDDEMTDAVRIAVRRVFRDALGKKPVTQVHLVRV